MFAALIPLLTSAFGTIIDRVVPDKAAADKAKQELASDLMRMAQESNLAQIDVNKTEAASGNLFVAGWRPFIGWTCGVALAWHFVLFPVTSFLVVLSGEDIPPLPVFDMDSLMTILLGMLGLGGLRTFEKFKGVSK